MIRVQEIWKISLFLLSLLCSYELAAQCLSGNCQNGSGNYRYTSGAKYSGEFYGGRPHGQGILQFSDGNRYEGQWENGRRNGQGTMYFNNKNRYEGAFKTNRMEGNGAMYYENGDRYDGMWSNNQPNGTGTYYFKSGERYTGSFQEGKFEGNGTMYYTDGASFSGQWHDNRKHGQGRMTFNDGQFQDGYWSNGEMQQQTSGETQKPNIPAETAKPQADVSKLRNCGTVHCRNGRGYIDYADGSRYVGEFKDGYPEGQGICYYSNNDRYEGDWKNNAPNGEGIMYFNSGRVYGAVWLNGAPIRELDKIEALPEVEDVSMDINKQVKIWAVVVGVSSYDHMPRLKFTDDDAHLFHSFLKSPEGGALKDEQIELLIDDYATRENILKAMRRTFAKADHNDEVVLYFSGHGLEGCFLPVDFDGHNNKLSHRDILQVFKESKAKYKLCIADACHSGTLNDQGLVAKSPVTVTLDRYYQAFENANGGTALLMSSKGEEVSLEDHGLRQGIFSHYLLRGLKGEADTNEDDIITIRELYAFVHRSVRLYTNNAQTPILTGDFDGAMPVSVKRY